MPASSDQMGFNFVGDPRLELPCRRFRRTVQTLRALQINEGLVDAEGFNGRRHAVQNGEHLLRYFAIMCMATWQNDGMGTTPFRDDHGLRRMTSE